MARVEIYQIQKGGSQKVIAEFRLVGDQVVGQGNESIINRLELSGVLDKSIRPPTKVFPKDGLKFLMCLRQHFTSGYLTASGLLEDKPIEEK